MPRPASISPELLQTFVTIVETGGDATRAAELLDINQPSMSKRLAFLQHSGKVLQRPWIERVGKTWHLTAEGKRALPAVEELVLRYKILTDAIDSPRPNATIGCHADDATGFLQRTLSDVRKQYPELTFAIRALPSDERIAGVANGSLDFAIVRSDEAEIQETARRPLFVKELMDDPMVLVADPGLPDMAKFEAWPDGAFGPNDLLDFPLLLPPAETQVRSSFNRHCRAAEIYDRLRIAVEAGPASTLIHFARTGYGIALVPRSTTEGEPGLIVKALPPKLSIPRTTRAVCRKLSGTDDLDLGPMVFEVWNRLDKKAG